MRKHELINCPQWLLHADTREENIVFDTDGRLLWLNGDFMGGDFVSGRFLGGRFMGGDFMNGDFVSGRFMGGDFMGGRFMGGDFVSGRFLGGRFIGGRFIGGDFMGGRFMGGDFMGGDFMGSDFMGESINYSPLSIHGLTWPINITKTHMKIGCQHHTHALWQSFHKSQISEMDNKFEAFWESNSKMLLAICAAMAASNVPAI